MPKGNPNPSPSTRFGAVNGNKPNGGKTSEQKIAEYQAAEKAALLSDKMLSSVMGKINSGADATDFIDPSVLKLMKDAQDRAHGTPTQSVHMSMEDDVRGKSDAEIDADIATIQKKLGIPQDDSDTAGS